MEIWDSNKYKKFFDSFSSDAFSKLGNEVMGGGSVN
jgi:MraZ protein